MNSIYWGNRGHCPQCGKFCGDIRGFVNPGVGLLGVVGKCSQHGDVDLSVQDWAFEEFCESEEEFMTRPAGELRR